MAYDIPLLTGFAGYLILIHEKVADYPVSVTKRSAEAADSLVFGQLLFDFTHVSFRIYICCLEYCTSDDQVFAK